MAYIKFRPLTAELNYFQVIDFKDADEIVNKLLIDKENVFIVCRAVRDLFILTDKRILIVDLKGVRGFRKGLYSIPFKSISTYCIDIHNNDTAVELITTSGYQLLVKFSKPIELEVMYDIYKYIAKQVDLSK